MTLGRRIGHAAELAGLLVFIGLFRSLPIDWASAVGGWLGRAIGPRLGISRRAARNLERAMPENSPAENRRIISGMWDNLGRTAAEYPHLPTICAEGSGRIEVVNGAAVTALAHDGRPGIIFGGHFANWEVGPYTLRRLLGVSLTSVYRAPNNPWIEPVLNRLRRAPDRIAKGSEGGRHLMRLLKGGGHVGILVDQKLNDGIAVPFFGRDAMTAPAVARFGLRFDCPLVPVNAERLGGARFRVTVGAPIELSATGDTERDVHGTMRRINDLLEGWVRQRPEQWLWLHNRWPS
jgi:KDO2-lipid IV(A) lauroyltransferase